MADTKATIDTTTRDKGKKMTHLEDEPSYTNGKSKVPKYNSDSKHSHVKEKANRNLLTIRYCVLLVVGSAVIGFKEMRNSLIWQIQRQWKASGEFWQTKWENVLSIIGEDPFMLWVVYSLSLTVIVYWTVGGIYTILDVTNKPAFIRKYKVQVGTNEPVDNKRLLQVISQVLFNQTVVAVPIGYLMFLVLESRGFPPTRVLPSFHRAFLELVCLIIIEEIGFYYSHRLLHNKYVYKVIHKKHHEWTAPIAITAVYCHPIEHILSNLLPPLIGVYIMGSHITVAWFWFSLAHLNTLNAHSGYHLPFFPSPEAHDFHHLKFNQCYGVLGILDRLHGTDSLFRSSKAFSRHIMMLSFRTARESFPDVK